MKAGSPTITKQTSPDINQLRDQIQPKVAKPVCNYQILQYPTRDGLTDAVRQALEEGWELHGQLMQNVNGTLMQAMVM